MYEPTLQAPPKPKKTKKRTIGVGARVGVWSRADTDTTPLCTSLHPYMTCFFPACCALNVPTYVNVVCIYSSDREKTRTLLSLIIYRTVGIDVCTQGLNPQR